VRPQSARNDANASASAYLEAGDLPIGAYDAIDRLATEPTERVVRRILDRP